MPIQSDTVERLSREEVGADKKKGHGYLEEGARQILTTLGASVFNPFNPKTIKGLKIDQGLYGDATAEQRELREKVGIIKKNKARDAYQNKLGELNAFAAHKGTVPQAVINIYKGRVTKELTESLGAIQLEVAYQNFHSTINELQDNYNIQNKLTASLHAVNSFNDAWKGSLFDSLFKLGTNKLFS